MCERSISVVFNISLEGRDFAHDGNYYLCKQGALKLLPSEIAMDVREADGGYEVELKSDRFVRGVWLSADDDDVFITDNCFDLLPGQTKKTFVKGCSGKPKLKVQTLNDI